MRVKARLESERKERFFRIISGVHGFSALALAMANAGELLGAGAIRWPWWYSCMLAAAVILPAASGASAWFRSAQSIKFRFLASASAMAPLAFAGYYTSPILWANVLVLCALIVFLARQSRANADGQQPPS